MYINIDDAKVLAFFFAVRVLATKKFQAIKDQSIQAL